MATSLLQLSHELLHCVLTEVEPNDIPNLMLTCKDLHNYIAGNNILHRDIYYKNWDVPATVVNWEAEVQNIIKLGKILESSSSDVKESYLDFVADRIQYLLKTAHTDSTESFNIAMLTDHFQDLLNRDAYFTSSDVFKRAGTHPQRANRSKRQQQLSAKLHCLYGLPITEWPHQLGAGLSPSSCTRQQTKPHKIHAYARSKVYDLREYTAETLWGPFSNDGSQSIDWEKVEAVLIDLQYNIQKYYDRTQGRFPLLWTTPWQGITPNSFVNLIPDDEVNDDEKLEEKIVKIKELGLELDQMDPYGVTGTWLRVVCFLDYNELYSYNFISHLDRSEARPPIDAEEGMLGIQESWRVTKIEPAGTEEDVDELPMDWSNFKGERLPVVHFAGVSRSLHANFDPDANSRIRGTVRQTPEGEIRWTTFSIFHGEERWRSESVQVGGLRSARGVVGNWFDKDFSVSGPAGPTAFWKESDSVSEDKLRVQRWPYF